MKVVNFALRSSPLSRIQKAFIYSSSKWRWLKKHQERCQAGGVKTKRQGRQADKPGSKSPIQPAGQSYLYLRDAREIHIANRRNQQRWRPQCSAASRLKSANRADECWLVHLAVKRSRSGDRERERDIKREKGMGKPTRTRTTALSPLGFPFPALCKFHGNIFCAGQPAQPSSVILSKRIYCN